jgi:hypothetical protein
MKRQINKKLLKQGKHLRLGFDECEEGGKLPSRCSAQ